MGSGDIIFVTPPNPEQLAWFQMNDLGNAERLKARAGEQLLFIRHRGWVAWDGRRWSADDGERRAEQAAHDVARAIREEAAALSEQIKNGRLPKSMVEAAGAEGAAKMAQDRLVALHKWAIKSGNNAQVRGMLARAAAEMSVDEDEFDTDPLAFNVRNGTLRFCPTAPLLEGGPEAWQADFRPHDPADRITRLAEVEYDPAATCPQWRARLELIQPEEDQRAQLQGLAGYALTGLTSEQQFYLQQGPGGDGKSATWGTLTRLWGDYHRRAQVQTFLEGALRSGSDHTGDIARLSGDIRLVTCSEPPKRSSFNANVIKQVTGGDKVTARAMREVEIEFVPHWKLVIECNGLPRVPVSDDGWWRRVRVIGWPFQFMKMGVPPEQSHLLQRRLLAEGPGILNWAIEGALRYLREGKVPLSRTTTRATAEYRRSSDPFDEWYLERCVTNDRSQWAWASELYAAFKGFCEQQGVEKVMSAKTFGLKLSEKQHERHKSHGNYQRLGIRLKTEGEMEADGRQEEAEDRAAGIAPEAPASAPDPREYGRPSDW